MTAELEPAAAQRTDELNRSNTALAAEIAEREAAEAERAGCATSSPRPTGCRSSARFRPGSRTRSTSRWRRSAPMPRPPAGLIDAGKTGDARDNLTIVGVTGRSARSPRRCVASRAGASASYGRCRSRRRWTGRCVLAGRVRDAGVSSSAPPRVPGAEVTAGRIRLEQILVNLLQNALDALGDGADPTIRIEVKAGGTDRRGQRSPTTVPASYGGGIARPAVHAVRPPPRRPASGSGSSSPAISPAIRRRLRLEPDRGAGAAFTLELPRRA